MLNRVYRLVAPRVFEPVAVEQPVPEGSVVVRPEYLSICNADQRYYQGRRPAEVLAEKLPMALIHEGVGRVVAAPNDSVAPGTRVVMVPNAPQEEDDQRAENYLTTSHFAGSGYDGFMEEYVVLSPQRLVTIPDTVEGPVAAFTEIVSVGAHALDRFQRFSHHDRATLGIWGDGNLGFIVGLLLRTAYPEATLIVIGRNPSKLADFTFADKTYITTQGTVPFKVDHGFECCGGDGSVAAIDQIIDAINPEGTLALLGVSENPVPINTRMVLEKGLRLFGTSRSGVKDFQAVAALYEKHPEIPRYLGSLVNAVIYTDSIPAMNAAFEADIRKVTGKTIMEWHG